MWSTRDGQRSAPGRDACATADARSSSRRTGESGSGARSVCSSDQPSLRPELNEPPRPLRRRRIRHSEESGGRSHVSTLVDHLRCGGLSLARCERRIRVRHKNLPASEQRASSSTLPGGSRHITATRSNNVPVHTNSVVSSNRVGQARFLAHTIRFPQASA